MDNMKLGAVESRFAEIIWSREPVTSGELVKLAQEELGWKKSTTYTVLKKLCDRGIFKNDGGTVTAIMSREEFGSARSSQFVEENFSGSLPAFIAAFTAKNKLSDKEIEEIRKLIEKGGQ